MSASILILITDGKGKGRLEIDGRLDLLGQFLSAVYGGDEKKRLVSQSNSVPLVTLPIEDPKQNGRSNATH